MRNKLICLILAILMSGCGGGGGDSDSSSLSLSLSPSSISKDLLESFSREFSVSATVRGAASGTVYVVIADDAGVIEPDVRLEQFSDGSYQATFETAAALSAGRHHGDIEIRLCGDQSCQTRYGGATLPYDFKVLPSTNLTPLIAFPGVDDWSTHQGNNAHTGYVPVTLEPAQFSPRWVWTPPNLVEGDYAIISLPVSDSAQQKAYLSSINSSFSNSIIYALDEFDGSVAWEIDFSDDISSAPAVFNSRVYTTITDRSGVQRANLAAYDAQSGAPIFQTAVSTQGPYNSYAAGQVVVSDNTAFANVAEGPLAAFDATSGSLLWTAQHGGAREVSSTFDTNNVYTYLSDWSGGGLIAVNKSNGTTAFRVEKPVSSHGAVTEGSPVLDGEGGILVRDGRDNALARFDLATQTLLWQIDGGFTANLAVSGGIFYARRDARLEARRVSDGGLLWTWPFPDSSGGFYDTIVVTDNLVFVSASETYAIDRATHQRVWSFPVGGWITLSATGVMYIRNGSRIVAVNLH